MRAKVLEWPVSCPYRVSTMTERKPLEVELRARLLEWVIQDLARGALQPWSSYRDRCAGNEKLATVHLALFWHRRGLKLPQDATAVEREFFRCVQTHEAGQKPDVEAAEASVPELSDELAELIEEWQRVVSEADDSRSASSEPCEPASTVWAPVLDRLRDLGPVWRRYGPEEKLAEGGMGIISRVRDHVFERDVAKKVIRDPGSHPRKDGPTPSDAIVLGRFVEEAQVTGQLDHPNIVPVHDFALDQDGRVFFTMKLVRGDNLKSVFGMAEQSASGWSRTRILGEIILKVCDAMEFAHEKGVVHRDLKPSNVMVGSFGEVYVMDWGLARVLDTPADGEALSSRRQPANMATSAASKTLHGEVVGTPAYMSPEQARGEHDRVGPTSDVYAVGAMLYHLLAGHMPYVLPGESSSASEIWNRVLAGSPNPLDRVGRSIPNELVAICNKTMARAPEQRYPSMRALASDLRAYLERRVVTAYRTGAWAELSTWIARNKAIAGTAAVSLVLIAALTTWFVQQLRSERDIAQSNEKEASLQRDRADANATEATAERARVLRLSDVTRLNELLEEEKDLWPAVPEMQARLRGWLDRADRLVQRQKEHETTLAELRRSGKPRARDDEALLGELNTKLETVSTYDEADAALVDSLADLERAYEFGEDKDSQWWHDTLAGLLAGLDALQRDNLHAPTIASVTERLKLASTVTEETIELHRTEWDEAIASIQNPAECPHYQGFVMDPQPGMIPLGRDPDSGLWEFALWKQTGETPTRDEEGKLVLEPDSGIVFVLIPGGTLRMGSPEGEIGRQPDEVPPHDVVLDPYFMSKFEMTQFQWQAFTGTNPSFYGRESHAALIRDGRHPVESVSWSDCVRELRRLGLDLPTEAQWEFAARAGTKTPWPCGADPECLSVHANLFDQGALDRGAPASWGVPEPWDDGHVIHAPVGEFRANAFGLHDTHGNLWEWCRDGFAGYDLPVSPGDGERLLGDSIPRYRASRGGCFGSPASFCRSARRISFTLSDRTSILGVRPCRQVKAFPW